MKESIQRGEPPERLSDGHSVAQFDGEEIDYDNLWGKDPEGA